MPNVNSSTFKNSSSYKVKKNPFVPFIIIVLLALAALMVQYWVMDVNIEMQRQIEEQSRQQEEEQQSQQQEEQQDSKASQ